MKNLIIFLLLSWICMANTCKRDDSENCHYAIIFSNNFTKDLYIRDTHYISLYPFASEVGYFDNTVQERYKVRSGEQDNRDIIFSRHCFEVMFKDNEYYSGTHIVYVFDATVVENTSWEIVAGDYLVLKRYDLSLDDLKQLDWKITYPPTEAMKDVKQYPPYGSE